jgi:ABC-2 type transport system permease protein
VALGQRVRPSLVDLFVALTRLARREARSIEFWLSTAPMLLGLPWLSLLGLTLALMLRVGYGLLLATLWLSPLILLAMAASAWLKRWGLPALVAGVIVVGKLLETFFGTPVVWVTGRMLLERAGRGLLTGEKPGGVAVNGNEDPTAMLAQAPGWLWDDALGATADLAHPLLLLALAVSAGCFALLVLRRRQGA